MNEIKLQLNDFDYIIIDDIYNGGVNFRMFSKSQIGDIRVFNDGCTQRMGISYSRIDNLINTLKEIQTLINYKNQENRPYK